MKIWPVLFMVFLTTTAAQAAESQSYTDKDFFYTVDFPSEWHVKRISKVSTFFSPLESVQDKFAENVSVIVENLDDHPGVMLIDYHRKGMAHARKMLKGFEVLEEAQTQFLGHEAIAVIYTMKDRGVTFKIKSYTFFVTREIYVLNYTSTLSEFDRYLKTAENLMRSIRVSP